MVHQSQFVDVVLPVFNEERALQGSVEQLVAHLRAQYEFRWRVVIVDNSSTDGTLDVAKGLSRRFSGEVTVLRLEQKGRGLALKEAWLSTEADVVSYMDIDLSTNLRHFVPLVTPLLSGKYQIAIGSRYLSGSRVTRHLKREIISRSYNLVIKCFFPRRRFVDAQCGFKALTREAVNSVVPLVQDNSWFFDTELLIKAEHLGFSILEVPVEWIEDLDSRVKILNTVYEDLKGLIRLRLEAIKIH